MNDQGEKGPPLHGLKYEEGPGSAATVSSRIFSHSPSSAVTCHESGEFMYLGQG